MSGWRFLLNVRQLYQNAECLLPIDGRWCPMWTNQRKKKLWKKCCECRNYQCNESCIWPITHSIAIIYVQCCDMLYATMLSRHLQWCVDSNQFNHKMHKNTEHWNPTKTANPQFTQTFGNRQTAKKQWNIIC